MTELLCHWCGNLMREGSLQCQVVVRVRSLFDGVIPEKELAEGEPYLGQMLKEIDAFSEQELNNQVYEDDAFVVCPECKEALMQELYSRLRPEL